MSLKTVLSVLALSAAVAGAAHAGVNGLATSHPTKNMVTSKGSNWGNIEPLMRSNWGNIEPLMRSNWGNIEPLMRSNWGNIEPLMRSNWGNIEPL
jgi:hypothetical protein